MATAEDPFALLSKEEELHPDLVPWLTEGDATRWAMLRHPYVYSIPHNPQQNAYVNEQYKQKTKAIIEAKEHADWGRYLGLHERPYRVNAFVSIRLAVHGRAYWDLVSYLWTDSENIWQYRSQWRQIWASKEPDREAVMDEEEHEQFNQLPIGCGRASRTLSWCPPKFRNLRSWPF